MDRDCGIMVLDDLHVEVYLPNFSFTDFRSDDYEGEDDCGNAFEGDLTTLWETMMLACAPMGT